MKKIGTYGDGHFYIGKRRDITGVFFGFSEDRAVNLICEEYDESVEGFVAALRAASADPVSRLLQACAVFIGPDRRDQGTNAYRELMAAYDVAEAGLGEGESEDDDAEE